MKKTILILIMISFEVCYSQEQGINKLTEIKEELIKKKQIILDSINLIDVRINFLKNKNQQSKILDSNYSITKTRAEAKIKAKPYAFDDIIGVIPIGEDVKVFSYKDGYWLVEKDTLRGYTSEMYLYNNQPMIILKSKKNENEIIKQYGEDVGKKINNHEIWIGMTAEMAKQSIGEPIEINRTVGNWGVHEQWVYDGKYYYFENGKMTSFQD